MKDFELNFPPSDAISKILFAYNNRILLASSWDTHLYAYNIDTNTSLFKLSVKSPILSFCIDDVKTNSLFTADLEGKICR